MAILEWDKTVTNNVVTLKTKQNMPANNRIAVTLKGGPDGVKTTDGMFMQSDHSFGFQTEIAKPKNIILWNRYDNDGTKLIFNSDGDYIQGGNYDLTYENCSAESVMEKDIKQVGNGACKQVATGTNEQFIRTKKFLPVAPLRQGSIGFHLYILPNFSGSRFPATFFNDNSNMGHVVIQSHRMGYYQADGDYADFLWTINDYIGKWFWVEWKWSPTFIKLLFDNAEQPLSNIRTQDTSRFFDNFKLMTLVGGAAGSGFIVDNMMMSLDSEQLLWPYRNLERYPK